MRWAWAGAAWAATQLGRTALSFDHLIDAVAVLPHFHKSFKHPRMTVPRSTAVVLLLASALLLAARPAEANIWSDISGAFSSAWRVGDGAAACAAAGRPPPAAGARTHRAPPKKTPHPPPTLGCRQKTREVFTNAAT